MASPSSSSNLKSGTLMALLSALVLSTTGIFIRYLTETYQIPALVLAFWRDGFVGLALLIVLRFGFPGLLKIRGTDFPYLAFFGLMLAVFNALWTLSVALNGAAVSTVLVYSSTAFTALLGRWLFKEHLDLARVSAIFFCLAGCALVSGALTPQAWQLNTLGILTGLLSGLWYAIYTILGKSAAHRGLSPWTTLLFTFGFAAFFLLVLNLIGILLPGRMTLPGSASVLSDFLWLKDAAGWTILFVLAVGPTLLGFGLYNFSLKHLSSNLTNLILTTEPAFTAGIAFIILGERLGTLQITGSVLILLAIFFLRLYEDRRERKIRPAGSGAADLMAGARKNE